MVGWLAQPIEKWPPISNEVAMQGDSQIAEESYCELQATMRDYLVTKSIMIEIILNA